MFCHSLLCASNSISPKQICQLVQPNPTCFPMSWLPLLAKRKQKSCFQPNFICKYGESNSKERQSGLHGTVSLGKALLSHSRAARSRASSMLASQSCSALSHHLGYITLLQVIACSLLNLLVLCPSATPTFPLSPFPPLLYTLLLLPFLVPLVLINCHTTRGCSFECFHVAK